MRTGNRPLSAECWGCLFRQEKELDALSLNADKRFPVKTTFKDGNCCVSGLQNQCEKLLKQGESKENIARFCIDSVCKIVWQMADNARTQYPGLPLIFSGGVSPIPSSTRRSAKISADFLQNHSFQRITPPALRFWQQ